MSAPHLPFCSSCLRRLSSPRYRTCDDCRARGRQRYQNQQRLQVGSVNTPNPPTIISVSLFRIPQGRPHTEFPQNGPYQPTLASSAASSRRRRTPLMWWQKLTQLSVIPFQQEWSKSCSYCSAPLLSKEKSGWCCDSGNRRLPRLPAYPTAFQHWLDTTAVPISSLSRRLNNLFAFSAIGATEGFIHFDGLANVVLTGRVYHRLLDLSQGEHSMRWFLYDETARDRQAIEHGVPMDAVQHVRDMLESVNPYLSTIRHALDQVEDQSTPLAVELRHLPAGGELAAIVNTHNLSNVHPRKVVFFRSGGNAPHYVHILSRHYEPLQFPLLFPHGTPGWGSSSALPLREADRDGAESDLLGDHTCPYTQIQWYRHLLLVESRFLIFGRLTCEYVVDMYSRTEEERLDYLKMSRVRQSLSFENTPQWAAADLIRNKIPASFMGSQAWASDQVADALALARELGKPSFFITMTSNPNWPEIVDRLRPGQHYTDIPSVVCRAFHVRLLHLKAFIKKHFQQLVYMVTVVEFQKRGLPHCHMLIKVAPEPPLEALDSIISAEIPDEHQYPALHAAVLRTNMHHQNHLTRPTSRCNKNGRCIYGFPQPVRERTTIDGRGRVHFRRRKEEDAWVVPYIPRLLDYMNCHIHVDVCSTVTVFIYLYKYLFKGPDRTRFRIRDGPDGSTSAEVEDEFRDYISGRYLSSSEAIYRIFSFSVTSKSPPVRCLSVHLENGQLGQMYQSGNQQSSMSDLLWYFRRPRGASFDTLTYQEFYAKYYFHTVELNHPLRPNQWFICTVQTRRGLRRKILIQRQAESRAVTRIHTIPPRIGELFYLRILLQHRPAFGFEHLRTIHNRLYPTYQEAAVALGLFEDESEAVRAMREAVAAYSRPSQLRFLFSHLLLDLPTPAMTLWEMFRDPLSADFALDHNESEATRLTLEAISRYLRNQGASLRQFGLPEPEAASREVNMELDAFMHRQDDLLQHSQQSYELLNPEQRLVYDRIIAAIGVGGCYFLDGKAGRGKTFLVNTICNRIRGEGHIACITGSTALSVTLYERGRTAHSMFGIPVHQSSSELVSKISAFSGRAELIRQAALIVWEEFPMANKAAIECVDSLLRQIMCNDLPFGNKPFLALGDFRQVAPVLRDVTAPAAVFDSSIRSSSLWRHFVILRLTRPIRNADDPAYAQWLDQVGDGIPPLDKTVPLHHLSRLHSMEEAADHLFPDAVLSNPSQATLHSFLSPLNLRVDEFNHLMLSRLPGEEATYLSYDSVKEVEDPDEQLPSAVESDYLAMLNEPGVPPHKLHLKTGAICSLLRNLCIEKGLVKNARVRVTELRRHIVRVELLRTTPSSAADDYSFYLPRINFDFQPQNTSWTVRRRQFPLRLAYATTFNSCQGLTLDKVVLDLTNPVFAQGQLYTSLSRVRRSSDIRILLSPDNEDCQTVNVVHGELLLPPDE